MKNVVGNFKFFPVGQGLFYGGNISLGNRNLFTFVYDCGTESKSKSYLDSAINSFKTFNGKICLPEINKLDLVVISHLHLDHFLGIYDLINQIGRPKKIFLPLIEGNDFVKEMTLFSIFYINDGKDFNRDAFRFFKDLYSKAKQFERDSYNFRVGEKDDNSDVVDSYMVGKESLSVPLFYNDQKIWRFDFIRGSIGKKDNVVIDLIHRDIERLLLDEDYTSIEKYVQNESDGLSRIREVFDRNGFKNDSSVNNTSTMLLHYPISFVECDINFFRPFYRRFDENVATLLTGDSKINKNQAKQIAYLLDKIEPCFLVTQLPHHGSNDNFKNLSKYLWPYIVNGVCVASFGISNTYGHPGNNVLHSFAGDQLIKVNEYKEYSYSIDALYL